MSGLDFGDLRWDGSMLFLRSVFRVQVRGVVDEASLRGPWHQRTSVVVTAESMVVAGVSVGICTASDGRFSLTRPWRNIAASPLWGRGGCA